jgi:Zinc dependent phospholipase C
LKNFVWRVFLVVLTTAMLTPRMTGAYSVFTHEELIDLTWPTAIRPLLLKRFPGTTPAQLRIAHAFAYGGCDAQDMGYYPFGNRFFSNLTHYVRTGDFINNLLLQAHSVNEYAFAIGAMSHYVGDSIGHSEAMNPATGVNFPKLAKKYGPDVTYDEDETAYVSTEFSFDIGQLSKRTFAPTAYMRYIGFRTPRKLLERAFVATYGIDVRELVGKVLPAMRSYRTSVRTFVPAFASAEVILHGKQFAPDTPGPAYDAFVNQLKKAGFERHWAYTYKKPGIGPHLLAIIIKIIPKIGPARYLAIKIPDQQTEGWYIKSVDDSANVYRQLLADLAANPRGTLKLANVDLDTGQKIRPGGYALADKTYAQLVQRLTAEPNKTIPSELRDDILSFYSNPNAPIHTKRNHRKWKRLMAELQTLKKMKVASAAAVAHSD